MTDQEDYGYIGLRGARDIAAEKMKSVSQVAFAHAESCNLGPVRVTEVLEVLKPFAESAACVDDGVHEDLRVSGDCSIEHAVWEGEQPTVGDIRAARSLYLKLGGEL